MELIRGQDWKVFLLSYKGRMPLSDYWLGFIVPYFCLSLLAVIFDLVLLRISGIALFQTVLSIVIIYPLTMVAIKRCHDRGRSGFFLLLGLIPLVNLWPIIELSFLRGTAGSNKYGPDPIPVSWAANL